MQTAALNANGPIRVGWVLSGDRQKASSRLQGYLLHDWMTSKGIASDLLAVNFNQTPSARSATFFRTARAICESSCSHIVFEAPEWPMTQLAILARSWGKRAIAVRCDYIPAEYDRYYDLTILPTEGLRDALGVRRAVIIDDLVEVPPSKHKTDYSGRTPLSVVWVGHTGYGRYITALVDRLREDPRVARHFRFEIISVGPFATKQWSESTVFDDVTNCDIALIPIPDGQWYLNKSSNRLAMMFALGMPTIASQIPAYRSISRHEENVLLARTEDEISKFLIQLQSAELRRQLGIAAKHSIGTRFSADTIGPQWVTAIASSNNSDLPPPQLAWHWRGIDFLLRLLPRKNMSS